MRTAWSWLPSILVIATVLAAPAPARAFIGADKLLRGAHFEIQGVAVRGNP